MRILLLSRYSRLGASSRIRSYQYLPYLEAQGFQVVVAPLLDDNYLKDLHAGRHKRLGAISITYLRRLRRLLSSRMYDLLWIEKELFPWLPAWTESLLARMRIPYVVDYDDAIFHRYDMHPSGVVRAVLGQKIDAVMRRASLVICGNEYLAQRARQAGARHVELLPSVIDLERYPLMPQSKNKVFTIGWIGSPVTARYLRIIRPALAEVCKGGKARLVVVGSGHIELNYIPAEIRPWSEETEVSDIQSFDVGIMPLENNPWEQGKCGYKLIQYMACGRPVVASPVGVNNEIVEDEANGFLASTIQDWVRALVALRDDAHLQERMGEAGRDQVEKQYCIQVTAPQLARLLLSVEKQDGSKSKR